MYGVVLHHTVEKYISQKQNEKEINANITSFNIQRYKTPFKTGNILHCMIEWVDFTDFIEGETNTSYMQSLLSDIYNKVSGSARKYVDNTADYVCCFSQQENKGKIDEDNS